MAVTSMQEKLDSYLEKDALTRSEVIWVLDYIKDQIHQDDPMIWGLSKNRLIANFYYYGKISSLLLHQWEKNDQEMDRLTQWLREAAYGLDSKSRSELQTD
jgi:hypothetical protein